MNGNHLRPPRSQLLCQAISYSYIMIFLYYISTIVMTVLYICVQGVVSYKPMCHTINSHFKTSINYSEISIISTIDIINIYKHPWTIHTSWYSRYIYHKPTLNCYASAIGLPNHRHRYWPRSRGRMAFVRRKPGIGAWKNARRTMAGLDGVNML